MNMWGVRFADFFLISTKLIEKAGVTSDMSPSNVNLLYPHGMHSFFGIFINSLSLDCKAHKRGNTIHKQNLRIQAERFRVIPE